MRKVCNQGHSVRGFLWSAHPHVKAGDVANAFDRDDQRNRKREAVLRVAASAFNRRGYANTSLDDIAASLGVSKPTLYQYFSSKQEILYRCHQLALDQGDAGIALAEVDRGSGLDKLFIYLLTYMRGFFGEIGAGPVLTDVEFLNAGQSKESCRTPGTDQCGYDQVCRTRRQRRQHSRLRPQTC